MYQPNYERIAHKIVHQTMKVAPGEQVVLSARTDTVPFAELMVAEIVRRGGNTTVLLEGDALSYAEITQSPSEVLMEGKAPHIAAASHADYNVTLGLYRGDPRLFQDLPSEKMAAHNRSRRLLSNALYGGKRKWLGIGYPTRQMADVFSQPWTNFFEMFWRAMDVDYSELHERAAMLIERLERSEVIHITSPLGTDLYLRRGTRKVHADDGRLELYGNLPCGEVYFAPMEDSANGRAVYDVIFHQGLERQFEDGVAVPITAREGFEYFMEVWGQHDEGRARLGEMGIGLNSAIRQPTGFLLTDEKIMGTVHLALGDASFTGGANRSSMHWDMVVLQPTVTLDDAPLLERGRFIH
jgi:aminopeptidase